MEQWHLTHGENEKSTLVFSDKINAEYNFDIRSGEVTIYIDNDMTLTNQGLKRSAINIEPKAKLNLYISEGVTLTVNSGLGEKGDENDYMKENQGGYAGIRVPWIDSDGDNERDDGEQAELNLYGDGTLVSYGGDAGDGNSYLGDTTASKGGSGGGRSWSWNRSEIGGIGSAYKTGQGSNGGDAESCGIVNVYQSLEVYSYGGAGGSGGNGTTENGGGAGGYPRSWYWPEVGARWCWWNLLLWWRWLFWRRPVIDLRMFY